jgi:hypothetical protein
MVVGGSHCDGSGLKVSLRARVDASELLLERLSVGTMVKVSMDETRCSDMVGWFHGGIENQETQCESRDENSVQPVVIISDRQCGGPCIAREWMDGQGQ